MANPKKKTSRSKRDKRRTHKKLELPAVASCSHCGRERLPHRVCTHCGYYKGEQIAVAKEKKS